MIANPKQLLQRSAAGHAAFLTMLPAIRPPARFVFRHLNPEARQEVIANCLVAYTRGGLGSGDGRRRPAAAVGEAEYGMASSPLGAIR